MESLTFFKKGETLGGILLQGFEILCGCLYQSLIHFHVLLSVYIKQSNMGVYIKNINILLSN